jgi:adenosylcobinamide kinase/adenosylcobinamide-phosphate guanylyltransferase
MELIIGGAFQGKKEYARGLRENLTFYSCAPERAEIDFSSGAMEHLELFVLGCLRENRSPRAYFEARESEWMNAILIADDISSGVVPMDAEMRAWREESGRLLAYLAGKAARVHRVFCGIGQAIK